MREKLTATGLDAGPDTIRWHLEHHDESAQVVNTDGLQSRELNLTQGPAGLQFDG